MEDPVAHETPLPTTDHPLDGIVEEALLNFVPPFRFATVEEGVYRGAYPTLRNFPFLRGLELRTIVSLTPEEPTYDLRCFASAHGISLVYIQVERYKGEAQLLPIHMNEVLQLLMNADRHPLYIHCLDGRHVVGLAIMGLRKLQRWDVNSSHLEYQRFTKSVQDEAAFIADYSGPVAVPHKIPRWLWNGTWCDSLGKPKRLHVAIRLKFPVVPPSPPAHFAQSNGGGAAVSVSAHDAAKRSPDGRFAAGADFVGSTSPMHPTPLSPGAAADADAYVDLMDLSAWARPAALPLRSPALLPPGRGAGRHGARHCHADMRLFSLRVTRGAMGAEDGLWDTASFAASAAASTRSAPSRAGAASGGDDDGALQGTWAAAAANAQSRSGDVNGSVSALKYAARQHHLVPGAGVEFLGGSAAVYSGVAKKPKRRQSL